MNILARIVFLTGHGFFGRSYAMHIPAALWVVIFLGLGFVAMMLMSALVSVITREK